MMNTQDLIEIAKQVPALVVLAFIVRMFLAFLKDARNEYRELMHWSHGSFERMHKEHLEARNEQRILLNRIYERLERLQNI